MTNIDEINRLAVYGTLARGRENNHQLEPIIKGVWSRGSVRGRLVERGPAHEMGYPVLELDENAPALDVQIFESPELKDHWQRLDEFEGPPYRRVLADVQTESNCIKAWIYVINE